MASPATPQSRRGQWDDQPGFEGTPRSNSAKSPGLASPGQWMKRQFSQKKRADSVGQVADILKEGNELYR
jgi:hypothetical protein